MTTGARLALDIDVGRALVGVADLGLGHLAPDRTGQGAPTLAVQTDGGLALLVECCVL
jgi:hypothetical protein